MDRNDESCRSGASVRPIKILRRGGTQNRGSKSWNRENRSSRPVLTESARGSPRLPRGYASGKNSVRDQTTSRTLTIFAWSFSCTTRCTFVCARCSIGDVKGKLRKKKQEKRNEGENKNDENASSRASPAVDSPTSTRRSSFESVYDERATVMQLHRRGW